MKKGDATTYILIGVAVVAIGLSVRAYQVFGNHVFQASIPTPPDVITTVQPQVAAIKAATTQTAAVTNPVVATDPKTGKPVKPGTQTAVVTPGKPTPPTAQTPVVPPPVVVAATPISLPYDTENFHTTNPWQAVIGKIGLKFVDGPYKRNLLTVSAGPTTTEGFAELAGSEAWTDYTYTLNTNFISGPAFSLIVRYQDSKNYTSCVFSEGGVTRINNVVNGKTTQMASDNEQIPTIPHVIDIDYTAKVNGNTVKCSVQGKGISAKIPDMAAAGGIGIEVYNQAPGTSALNVVNFQVSE